MKIKITILIIVQTLFFSALSAQISQEQADAMVQQRMSQETLPYTVYAKKSVQTKMTVTTSADEELELDYPCWVYYAHYPTDCAAESCYIGRYLIVKESNGNLLEVKAKAKDIPSDLAEWRILKKEFCSYINLENIDKTIPVVNEYLCNLPKDLSNEQKMQALSIWFKSYPCVIDARAILSDSGYPSRAGFAFSFEDDGIIRELILDFSTTGKVVSYHYDIVNGAYVKTKDFTIDKVFEFINSLDFDVDYIYNGSYVSTMSPDNLQYILDSLNAKPYTNRGAWRVTGYLHYSTNQITIFPRLFGMKNKDYQADWLKSMKDYKLVERLGHIIVFKIPENPENKGVPKFEEYEFVEWVQLNHNRYTIYDKSIETGGNSGIGISVDSKINIRMVEIFDKSPRTLQLHCSTTKMYSSGSNPIYMVSQQSSNNIDISFKGVLPIGMTADIGPAKATINLGALNTGTYNLNLYNGDIKHTGELVVSSDSYKINFPENSDFHFTNTPLNKIPKNTIWGLIGYHKQETSPLVQSFLAELTKLGAEKKLYTQGYYNSFEIDKDGDIVTPNNHGYWFAKPFIFNYPGNIANVEQLVKQYAYDYGTEYLYIRVYTDKGEQILSWMYK